MGRPTHPTRQLPHCGHSSAKVHSRYERTLAGAAIGGQHVVLRLRMRRFFCHHHSSRATVSRPWTIPGQRAPGSQRRRPHLAGCTPGASARRPSGAAVRL
ncbi:MAG TPA: transposase family protein [Actinomycetes bacterium]|nr:transposase family protein [Actinomycetes bacterium]